MCVLIIEINWLKWTKLKFWTQLFAFYFVWIPFKKEWIHLFYHQNKLERHTGLLSLIGSINLKERKILNSNTNECSSVESVVRDQLIKKAFNTSLCHRLQSGGGTILIGFSSKLWKATINGWEDCICPQSHRFSTLSLEQYLYINVSGYCKHKFHPI